MSKLFIGMNLLIHAVTVAVILTLADIGMWVALGVMIAALAASIYIRKNAEGKLSERTYTRAKSDLVYATLFAAIGAGWYTQIASQGLAWGYLLLPLVWGLLYLFKLSGVYSSVNLAADFAKGEAERRELRAKIEAAQQNNKN